MSVEHTPGPWALDPENWGNILCAQSGFESDFPKIAGRVATVGYRPNAVLIAAAPELLTALWNLSFRVAQEGGDTAEVDRVIRKATGQ